MWPFSASKRFLKAQQRDALIVALNKALSDQDTPAATACLDRFFKEGHAQGKIGSDTVINALFAVDRYDMAAAMELGVQALPKLDKDQARVVAHTMMLLCEVPGRSDARTNAGICEAANAAAHHRHGHDIESMAERQWQKTVAVLGVQAPDLAIKAASDAALNPHSWTMSKAGLEYWHTAITKLSITDKPAAEAEVARVAAMGAGTGTKGEILQARARRVAIRLGEPG